MQFVLFFFLYFFPLVIVFAPVAAARIRHHKWEVTYQFKSPDCYKKLAVVVNGQTPGPTIFAQQGDLVVVEVKNGLVTENTAIHWHGIRQIGTPWYDGTEGITQCPILPGETFIYKFVVDRMAMNPLSKLLDDNKLTGPNYSDWRRNLDIVLTAHKIHYVVDGPPAEDEDPKVQEKWVEGDTLAKCYVLASLSPVLQQQHSNFDSCADIIRNLKEMFGEVNRHSRFQLMKQVMKTSMVEGTPVRDHVLKMIGYFNELETLGAEFDWVSKNDMILSTLPPSFNQFVINYNMNKLETTLPELLNMLKSAEDCMDKGKQTALLTEAGASESKGKTSGSKKRKSEKSKGLNGTKKSPNNNNKKKKGKGSSSSDTCHFCHKKGHWLRNCRKYLESLKKDEGAKSEGDQKAK